MSWWDLAGDAEPELRTSTLESDRFGRSVARLLLTTTATLDDEGLVELVGGCDADVVVLRYPASQVGRFAALLATGRTVIHADQLVYWRLAVGSGRSPGARDGSSTCGVDELDPALATSLIDELVADIFTGYANHYLADPLFDPAAALAGYQEWARSMVGPGAGDGIVLLAGGEPIGIATTTARGEVREIELAGIRPAWQRGGRYAALLAAVEELAGSRGETAVVISTQGHNTDVQRAWARFGFEPVGAWTTVHLVRPGLLGQT